MKYPRNIVWFIRADEDGQPPSEGSAVAIRLVRKGMVGDTGKLYLLTCAHVVRKGTGNENEFGPCYRRIRAWAPGWSFSDVDPQSGVAVSPVHDVIPTISNSKDFYQRPVHLDGHSDWVILEFEDRSISETFDRPSVHDWKADNAADGRICSIIGYPEGSAAFRPPNRNAEPTLGFEKVPIKRQEAGLICFEGMQTRPGMSGGGVFDAETNILVGFHRERYDEGLQLTAVSIQSVLLRLNKLGYEPVWTPVPPDPRRTWPLGVAAAAMFAISISLCVPLNRIPLASGIDAVPTPGLQLVESATSQDPHPAGQSAVIEGEFRFDSNHQYHKAYLVPDGRKLVVRSYHLDSESIDVDLLAVVDSRSTRLATLEAGVGGSRNNPWIFPEGSHVILFGAGNTGRFKYRLSGELQPIGLAD